MQSNQIILEKPIERSGVYAIINLFQKRVYVGETNDYYRRMSTHIPGICNDDVIKTNQHLMDEEDKRFDVMLMLTSDYDKLSGDNSWIIDETLVMYLFRKYGFALYNGNDDGEDNIGAKRRFLNILPESDLSHKDHLDALTAEVKKLLMVEYGVEDFDERLSAAEKAVDEKLRNDPDRGIPFRRRDGIVPARVPDQGSRKEAQQSRAGAGQGAPDALRIEPDLRAVDRRILPVHMVLSEKEGVDLRSEGPADLEGSAAGAEDHEDPGIEDEQREDRPRDLAGVLFQTENDQACDDITEADARQDAEDTLVLEPVEIILAEGPGLVVWRIRIEGIQVQQQAHDNDRKAPADHLPAGFPVQGVVFRERERHRAAHAEDEEGEDQVRRRATRPFGMAERRVDLAPGPGIVDDAHEGDRQAAEHIQGRKTLFHIR